MAPFLATLYDHDYIHTHDVGAAIQSALNKLQSTLNCSSCRAVFRIGRRRASAWRPRAARPTRDSSGRRAWRCRRPAAASAPSARSPSADTHPRCSRRSETRRYERSPARSGCLQRHHLPAYSIHVSSRIPSCFNDKVSVMLSLGLGLGLGLEPCGLVNNVIPANS